MRLAEVLLRKSDIEYKIKELEDFMYRSVKDNSLSQEDLINIRKELEENYEKNQRLSLQIKSANDQITVTLGSSKVPLSDALVVRKTLINKLRNIDNLIEAGCGNIEILSFIEQREKIFEEFMILNSSIVMVEWSANLD